MPSDSSATAKPAHATTLEPSYRIPVGLFLIALPVMALQIWVGAVLALFSAFLLSQAYMLRLVFTETDLDIYRGESRIRRFPYQAWNTWEIFWSPIPILFYFREVNSIHFLPILFKPDALRQQLQAHIPLDEEGVASLP